MQLMALTPPEFGVTVPGIYVLDHDRASLCAGPFATPDAALDWITQSRQTPPAARPDRGDLPRGRERARR